MSLEKNKVKLTDEFSLLQHHLAAVLCSTGPEPKRKIKKNKTPAHLIENRIKANQLSCTVTLQPRFKMSMGPGRACTM